MSSRLIVQRRRLLHGLRLGESCADCLGAFRKRASQEAHFRRPARGDIRLQHHGLGHYDGRNRKLAARPADQLGIGQLLQRTGVRARGQEAHGGRQWVTGEDRRAVVESCPSNIERVQLAIQGPPPVCPPAANGLVRYSSTGLAQLLRDPAGARIIHRIPDLLGERWSDRPKVRHAFPANVTGCDVDVCALFCPPTPRRSNTLRPRRTGLASGMVRGLFRRSAFR